MVLQSESEFFAEGAESLVVPAALVTGVLDPARHCDTMSGLVEQGTEHANCAPLESFAADEQLMEFVFTAYPSVRREVPQGEVTADRSRTYGQHHLRHVRVVGTDCRPGAFHCGDK